MMKNCLALKRKRSKLNTAYWTFTVLDFTVGWHAVYNQLLFTGRHGHFFPQRESLCLSVTMTILVEGTDFMRSAHFFTQKSFSFLAFLFVVLFVLLKAKIWYTPHLYYVETIKSSHILIQQ